MKAIVKKVGEMPNIMDIPDTLKCMQHMVDGYVEVVGSRVCNGNFVVNEDGTYMCEFNCYVEGHAFYGTIVYVGPMTQTFNDADKMALKHFRAQSLYGNLRKDAWIW
jgi:D-arabinose 1-dehydrogenase-like Zn-dependent alcohol dehydrogenase